MRLIRSAVMAAFAAAALVLGGGVASAADLPNPNWACENPAGHVVHGTCTGEALDAVNPGGNVPPGVNK